MIGILIFLLIAIIIYRMVSGPAQVQTVRGNNHQFFDKIQFSSQEFYDAVQAEMGEREIRGLSFSRITYAEAGLLSARREYLRIKRREYVFDICAAPFGRGTFVSWWLGEVSSPGHKYLIRIPIIGRLFVKRLKTYFELDNEQMFKETVISVVNLMIEKCTELKGVRLQQPVMKQLEYRME